MPWVHSLVKTEINRKKGWLAPLELGEATPQYVSFAIPLDEEGAFFPEYRCQTIRIEQDGGRIEDRLLAKQGLDSFLLRIGDVDFWFAVKPGQSRDRALPYLGKLEHPDFHFLLAEIEAEEPRSLDLLFDKENTLVIGCDPFSVYGGMTELQKAQLVSR